MMDYMYEMGSLYGNKKRAEILDEFIHSSDPSVSKYARKILEPRYKEMLGDIIGIQYSTPLKKWVAQPMARA